MNQSKYHQDIIEYYDKAEVAYRDVWDLNHSMAFHCGFWTKGISTIREALLNQNAVMAQWVDLKQNDHLLDAGCGIGGSAMYVAQHIGCQATGLSLAPNQIKQAKAIAQKKGLKNVHFKVGDYCQMPFDDHSFDVVWAIESVCYAIDKLDFIQEAFRVLKPGGRLIVADGFRNPPFTNKGQDVMQKWEEGYAVHELASTQHFEEDLTATGFKQLNINDTSNLVMPSARKLYYFGKLAFFYRKFRQLFGLSYGNEITIKNTQAAIYQYIGLKNEYWKYIVFTAQKPK